MSQIILDKSRDFVKKSCFVNNEKNALFFYQAGAYEIQNDVFSHIALGCDKYKYSSKKAISIISPSCINCKKRSECDIYNRLLTLFEK